HADERQVECRRVCERPGGLRQGPRVVELRIGRRGEDAAAVPVAANPEPDVANQLARDAEHGSATAGGGEEDRSGDAVDPLLAIPAGPDGDTPPPWTDAVAAAGGDRLDQPVRVARG